jgi:SAM-dependent methyltransferase
LTEAAATSPARAADAPVAGAPVTGAVAAGGAATLRTTCPVCGSATEPLATLPGKVVPWQFELRHCPTCRLSFVANPCTDYARIYDEAYYRGCGADPMVDYVFEMEHPDQTVRQYEWRGIVSAVRSMTAVGPHTRWLDYGCGNGGLVRYLRDHAGVAASGYDVGWITSRARESGLPILSDAEVEAASGTFDVVTAIEVLEHIADPVDTLRKIRALLKPGGLFFYTTGNAEPFRGRLPEWGYVRPDIHISFFEPATLDRALRAAGFRPEFRGFTPGFTDIIRFKALKNLGVRRSAAWQRLLPWRPAARLLDRRLRISAHPVGWAEK